MVSGFESLPPSQIPRYARSLAVRQVFSHISTRLRLKSFSPRLVENGGESLPPSQSKRCVESIYPNLADDASCRRAARVRVLCESSNSTGPIHSGSITSRVADGPTATRPPRFL